MPLLPPCLICDGRVQTPTRVCTNRSYWSPNGGLPATQSILQAAAEEFKTHFAAFYAALLSPSCSFIGVKLTVWDPNSELEAFSTGAVTVGTATGEPLPDETCLVIQRRTGRRGRENRGRVFISGISEAVNLQGKLVEVLKPTAKNLEARFQGGPTLVAGSLGFCTPKHWDRKNNSLEDVVDARVMDVLMSRRDRRKPLIPQAVP